MHSHDTPEERSPRPRREPDRRPDQEAKTSTAPGSSPAAGIMSLQRTVGNHAVAQLLAEPLGHPGGGVSDLAVTEPDDAQEREADREAGEVAGPAAASMTTDTAGGGGGATGGGAVSAAVQARLDDQAGGGSPLPERLRARAEQRLGADFGGVRVHHDTVSAQLSRDLEATAFAHGGDIYLGDQAPSLGSTAGEALLTHELTHVAQAGAPARPRGAPEYLHRGMAGGAAQRLFDGKLGEFRAGHDDRQLDRLHTALGEPSATQPAALTPLQRNRIARRGSSSTKNKPSDVEPVKPKPTEPHKEAQKPTFSLAGGQQILTAAFGSIKKIVPGTLQLLDEPDFIVAYDKIYGSGQWSWERYVKPTYGSLNGFAHDNVNYINKKTAGLHTVVHEMLHNNTAGDWRGVVGSRWDEGTTEVLTQEACKPFNEPAPVCYPGESPVVREALAQGLPLADLEEAYLKGGAQAKIATWADTNCKENWASIKSHMENKDWAAAKTGLGKK